VPILETFLDAPALAAGNRTSGSWGTCRMGARAESSRCLLARGTFSQARPISPLSTAPATTTRWISLVPS
jgi:hypothetical protein